MALEKTVDFGKVQDIDVLNLSSLEKRAAKVIGKGEFGYIEEGSDDEYTKKYNTAAFKRFIYFRGSCKMLKNQINQQSF